MGERIGNIQRMHKITDTWDGSAEHAQEIVGLLKPLIAYLSTMEETSYSQEEKLLLQVVVTKQLEMIAVLKAAKKEVAAEIRAMNKKDAVVKNYLYPNRQPTFVNHHL